MPADFVFRMSWFPKKRLLIRKAINSCKKYCTSNNYVIPKREDNYSRVPEYPSIEKVDENYEERKKIAEWHNLIKRQKTVEEKIFAVNVPRYWGWKCFVINEGIIPFDNLHFIQHLTRSHLIRRDHLPQNYQNNLEKCSQLSNSIKDEVQDSISYQLGLREKCKHQSSNEIENEREICKKIVQELNRIILKNLCVDEPHLKNIQVDYKPRIESFWQNKSIVETLVKKQNPDGLDVTKLPEEYEDRPSDKFFQYIGHPLLHLRHNQPLSPLIDLNEALYLDYPVPKYQFDPHLLGYQIKRRHLTNIPGFWPGDEREFSFLSYHSSNHSKFRPSSYGRVDQQETLECQAISASFGWLMSLASYQGFSSFHDVTYPFVNQSILTDGKEFAFSVYQLNTTKLYHQDFYENSKCNLCWMTPSVKLYESFQSGKLQGFNEDVLKMILSFYLNRPTCFEGINLKPYLGDAEKVVADYQDDEKAEWLEDQFKHFSRNSPRCNTQIMYEVYDWERIFIIENRRYHKGPKLRPYYFGEIGVNPYHRKMSECRKYIPKAIRKDKHLPKHRQRHFIKTFYPE